MYFSARNMKFQPVIMENQDTMYQAFFAGRCDALSQDSSALAVAVGVVSGKPADFVVLPERISKEPLGPFVRQGDETWGKIVRWTLSVMIEAEELGVTQARVEELSQSGTAAQKRLLGAGDDMGKPLGLDPKWSANVIRAVGNYGESFEREPGPGQPAQARARAERVMDRRRPDVRRAVPVSGGWRGRSHGLLPTPRCRGGRGSPTAATPGAWLTSCGWAGIARSEQGAFPLTNVARCWPRATAW